MQSTQTNYFIPGRTVSELKRCLEAMNYSATTISRLNTVWNQFDVYWQEKTLSEFTVETIDEFISFRYGYAMGEKDRGHNVRRAMNMLWDYTQYRKVFTQSTLTIIQFHSEFRAIFEAFLSHLQDQGYSSGSVKTFRSNLLQTEAFFMAKGIHDLESITQETISQYVIFLSRYSAKTTLRKLRLLKKFLEYAHSHGYMGHLLQPTVPKLRAPGDLCIPTTLTVEQVRTLLASVDKSNPLGKRNYAILALAAGLGLRISDILGLTFGCINWSQKRISIIQKKTGKPIELPLTDEIGWAIIDYLQSGRPQSSCTHIFIKHCAPYDALSSSIYRVLRRYLAKAEITIPKGKSSGMHILRHSLASAMLEQKIPLPIISGTLGHTDTYSTETYLSIDIDQLRECALEVAE